MTKSLTGHIAIVGGSLAGLATGIGLARRGLPVNVFEQNAGEERGGTGLGVDRTLITQTTGVGARVDGFTHALPVVDDGDRETSTWLAIYRWLRAVAEATNGLNVHESARVDVVSSDDHAAYLSGPRVNASAAVIIGADGYRSVVRPAVSPTRPFAPYGDSCCGARWWRNHGCRSNCWREPRWVADACRTRKRRGWSSIGYLGRTAKHPTVNATSRWPGTTPAAHNGCGTADI